MTKNFNMKFMVIEYGSVGRPFDFEKRALRISKLGRQAVYKPFVTHFTMS